jgi:hypothetical protein
MKIIRFLIVHSILFTISSCEQPATEAQSEKITQEGSSGEYIIQSAENQVSQQALLAKADIAQLDDAEILDAVKVKVEAILEKVQNADLDKLPEKLQEKLEDKKALLEAKLTDFLAELAVDQALQDEVLKLVKEGKPILVATAKLIDIGAGPIVSEDAKAKICDALQKLVDNGQLPADIQQKIEEKIEEKCD